MCMESVGDYATFLSIVLLIRMLVHFSINYGPIGCIWFMYFYRGVKTRGYGIHICIFSNVFFVLCIYIVLVLFYHFLIALCFVVVNYCELIILYKIFCLYSFCVSIITVFHLSAFLL
jgi:hypothetical protein